MARSLSEAAVTASEGFGLKAIPASSVQDLDGEIIFELDVGANSISPQLINEKKPFAARSQGSQRCEIR